MKNKFIALLFSAGLLMMPCMTAYGAQTQEIFTPIVEADDVSTDTYEYGCASKGEALTAYDLFLIAQVVQAEAGNQTFITKVACAQALINRFYSSIGEFPDTIPEIITQRNQFEVADDYMNYSPTDDTIDAVLEAYYNRPFPLDMMYFNSIDFFDWATDYLKIDDMYFSLYPEKKLGYVS